MTAYDWTPALATLREQLADLFVVWLPRLSVLLGPAEALPSAADDGELDGVRGLTRRGQWDRLVLTEWALADSVPLEFLRRATDGELLFTEPARVSAVHAPVTTVYFDDGPTQLGVPRLVHLALWMVLAERAREAKGELRCHVRSAPERRLGTDPLELLDHRAAVLPPLPEAEGGERIIVGTSVPGETMIEVVEVGTTLEVRHAGRTVVLERPSLQVAASLLARPRAPRPHRSGPRQREGITALTLAQGRILVRFGSVLTIWPLPSRSRARIKPRYQSGRWREGTRRLVAVGTFARQMVLVELDGEQLVFSGAFGTHQVRAPVDLVPAGDDQVPAATGMPRVYLQDEGVKRAGVVFADGAGVVWAATAQPPVVLRLGTTVVGPVAVDGQLSWITPDGERSTTTYGGAERLASDPSQTLRCAPLLSGPVERGLAGPVLDAALVRDDRVWIGRCFGWGRLTEARGTWRALPAGRLVGVCAVREVALLCVENGRAVLHAGEDTTVLETAMAEEVVFGGLTEDAVVVADARHRVHVYGRSGRHHRVSFGWEDIR